ncbi:uncharacterized protein MONBRDRAFT_12163 [Monosiga brevicollis MX1]|uniref:Uncharacterized protein n=1 Tax=Monosiga brevicollis TaxID=81824 RepID=A9VBE6_MONBE|nr:uncharacterized protein MONBRDRAFT_12163 [Monosiga brevicollis MX1]EDQ85223.1 predicted protein [Monosiga brevicollis MX1]|eukprot:XP_001750048.1 hypothetical protein [Monosiga brevicollis MX1]
MSRQTRRSRYSMSQQPWAVGTLGQQEHGIIPEEYESKIGAISRNIRTAPTALGDVPVVRRRSSLLTEDDLSTVVSDPMSMHVLVGLFAPVKFKDLKAATRLTSLSPDFLARKNFSFVLATNGFDSRTRRHMRLACGGQ